MTDRQKIESITDRRERLNTILSIIQRDLDNTDFNTLTEKEIQAYENTMRKFMFTTKRLNY